MSQNLFTKITPKQIATGAIMPEHISGDTISYLFSLKKTDIARIVNGVYVPSGVPEIDVTELIYNNSYFQTPLTAADINGVLLSGNDHRIISNIGGILAIRGKCFDEIEYRPPWGIYYGENNEEGQHIGDGNGINSIFNSKLIGVPIVPFSIKIYVKNSFGETMIVNDNGYGKLIGDGVQVGYNNHYGLPINRVDYNTGEISVYFRSPPANNEKVVVKYRYRGGENYKVLIRNSKTKTPYVNSYIESGNVVWDGEVFGELYAVEYYPSADVSFDISRTDEGQILPVNCTKSKILGYGYQESGYEGKEYYDSEKRMYIPYDGDRGNFRTKGSILCKSLEHPNNNDTSIGLVDDIIGDEDSPKIVLRRKADLSYSGKIKFVRFKIKFFTTDMDMHPVGYSFASNEKIDFLFIESYNLSYPESVTNNYRYFTFYRVGPTITSYLRGNIEEKILEDKLLKENGQGTFLYNIGEHSVPAMRFKTSKPYAPGSLEVYVDGVKIMRWSHDDAPVDMRFIEEDPNAGVFVMLNLDYDDFYKRKPNINNEDVGTQQVYVSYVEANSNNP